MKSGNIPFITLALTNLIIWGQAADRDRERQTHEDCLDSVLRSWDFERITVPGDGDCLYTSVAMNIKHLCQLGTESLCNILKDLSIDPNTQSIPEIVSILRKAVVNEWLGENTGDYQSFLTSDRLQEQAQAFLNSGMFAGDIGDLVVRALTNVLKSPIVVFTSMENMPTIVITPPHVAIANTHPLHIAFNAHGLGHYDAAFWASPEPQQLSQESTSPQQPTCSCGRKSTKGTPCSLQLNVYTTRCPCYNLQSGCNHKCRCKNCQNPYGKRLAPAQKPATGSKRKFEPHTYQKQSLKGIKTMKFMNQVSEPVKTEAFSIIETFLISAIIQNLYNSDQQVTLMRLTH